MRGQRVARRDAIGLDRNTVEATARGLDRVIDQLGAIGRTLVLAASAQTDRTKPQGDLRTALDAIRITADNNQDRGNRITVGTELLSKE